ncbi:MAG: dihydrofolate reductase, partial [Bdellovibrionota bacterium]
RLNIVMSRSPRPATLAPEVVWVASLPEALSAATIAIKTGELLAQEVFVIGGSQLFAEALPIVARLYITWIGAPYEGDCRFPQVALERDFKLVESHHSESLDPPLKFSVYDRI